jgi:hypothetical protein
MASSAHAPNYDFSMTNTVGNVDGTVLGEVFGLTDNATGTATGIVVTSYPGGLNIGAVPLDQFDGSHGITLNSFTATDGAATVLVMARLVRATYRGGVLHGWPGQAAP